MHASLYSFFDELEKIALEKRSTVPRAVKQYRRAMQQFVEGGNLFHGSHPDNLRSITESGKLLPHPSSHGEGTYFWRDMPLLSYLRTPEHAGLSFSAKALGPVRQPKFDTLPQVETNLRRRMLVAEGPTSLPPGTPGAIPLPERKKTTVIAPESTLKNLRELIATRRYRQIASPLFHQAEADWRAHNLGQPGGVKKLQKLLKKPITYHLARSGTPRDAERFLDDYVDKISLT